MSKAAKSRASDKRKKIKRQRKEAQRTQYASWAASGENKKSKRFRLKSSRNYVVKGNSHPDGACGNIGCKRCQPFLNDPLHAKSTSCIWSKRFTNPKMRRMLAL